MKQGNKEFSRIGISFLLAVLVFYLVYYAIYAILYKFCPEVMSNNLMMILNFGLMYVLVYPLVYLVIKDVPKTEIPQRKLKAGMIIASIPVSYALMVLCNIVALIINTAIGNLTGKGAMNPIVNVIGGMNIWMQLIIVVIVAPIAEELVFRKWIIDRVYKYGELFAILTSALMFGLFHGNFQQFAYAFGVGTFFAFIYIKTGRIRYSAICHMVVNFMGSIASQLVTNSVDVDYIRHLIETDYNAYMAYVAQNLGALSLMMLFGLMVILLVVAGVVLMIVFHKKLKFTKRPQDASFKQAMSLWFCSIGMVAYFVWWIANIVTIQFGTSISNLVLEGIMKLIN